MLNGAPIEHPKPLNDKDIISICGRTFRRGGGAAVAAVEAASAKKATPKSAAKKGKSPKPATPRRTPPARATRCGARRRARRAAG